MVCVYGLLNNFHLPTGLYFFKNMQHLVALVILSLSPYSYFIIFLIGRPNYFWKQNKDKVNIKGNSYFVLALVLWILINIFWKTTFWSQSNNTSTSPTIHSELTANVSHTFLPSFLYRTLLQLYLAWIICSKLLILCWLLSSRNLSDWGLTRAHISP